jgi:hypothetical protein
MWYRCFCAPANNPCELYMLDHVAKQLQQIFVKQSSEFSFYCYFYKHFIGIVLFVNVMGDKQLKVRISIKFLVEQNKCY